MTGPDPSIDLAPEAVDTVRAIQQGAVDAIVLQGPDGPEIVTLSGSAEPYRVLVERMSDGAATVSPEGTVLYVNQRLGELTGLGSGAIVGHPFSSLFEGAPPELTAGVQGIRSQAMLLRRGSAALPVSVWAGAIVMGNVAATLVTVTDLSDQRRAEEIASAERFSRSILDQATDAIVVLDPHGRIMRASGVAEELANERPVGRMFTEAFAIDAGGGEHDALAQFSTDVLDKLLATRVFHGVEVRLRADKVKNRAFLLSAGPLLDDAKRSVGSIVTLTDISARKRAEEQQTVLVAELNHRVKNILAIVQSVATQTVRNASSLETFQNTFDGRLKAISKAHDVLTKTRWTGVAMAELLAESFAVYREQIATDGPPTMLPSQSVVPLSMALHELMTNAVKYGALSTPGGRVELAWERVEAGPPAIRLTWRESGGPAVGGKPKSGFGSTLIERVVSYDLDGRCTMSFEPSGLRCTLQFPIEADRPSIERPSASAGAMA